MGEREVGDARAAAHAPPFTVASAPVWVPTLGFRRVVAALWLPFLVPPIVVLIPALVVIIIIFFIVSDVMVGGV